MKERMKKVFLTLMVFSIICFAIAPISAFAAEAVSSNNTVSDETVAETETDANAETDTDSAIGDKAMAAAIAVGIAAAGGAVGMGMASAKSLESIARQPEAEGKIRTTLMLGMVFIETAIIYALVIAILVIFVL